MELVFAIVILLMFLVIFRLGSAYQKESGAETTEDTEPYNAAHPHPDTPREADPGAYKP